MILKTVLFCAFLISGFNAFSGDTSRSLIAIRANAYFRFASATKRELAYFLRNESNSKPKICHAAGQAASVGNEYFNILKKAQDHKVFKNEIYSSYVALVKSEVGIFKGFCQDATPTKEQLKSMQETLDTLESNLVTLWKQSTFLEQLIGDTAVEDANEWLDDVIRNTN